MKTLPQLDTASITNNGTFDASTAGEIRFTCAAGLTEGTSGKCFTDNGVFAISVYVVSAHIACRVGSVVGAGGGTLTTIGYFEDGLKSNYGQCSVWVEVHFVFNKTAGTSYPRIGVGVDAGRAEISRCLSLSLRSVWLPRLYREHIYNYQRRWDSEDEPRFDYTEVVALDFFLKIRASTWCNTVSILVITPRQHHYFRYT